MKNNACQNGHCKVVAKKMFLLLVVYTILPNINYSRKQACEFFINNLFLCTVAIVCLQSRSYETQNL